MEKNPRFLFRWRSSRLQAIDKTWVPKKTERLLIFMKSLHDVLFVLLGTLNGPFAKHGLRSPNHVLFCGSPVVTMGFNTKMAYWDDDDQVVSFLIGFWGMVIAPWMGSHWILLKNGLSTPPRGPWHNMSHQDSQVHGSIHDPNGLKW